VLQIRAGKTDTGRGVLRGGVKRLLQMPQWPCNTSSETSSKSNTTNGKTVLKFVKILIFRNIGL
jgi:hypothetical protein